jgi:hypothetical protein
MRDFAVRKGRHNAAAQAFGRFFSGTPTNLSALK